MEFVSTVADVKTNITNVQSKKFTINVESMEHIMGVLTNLYSLPEVAVLRETLSNAIDSHNISGQTLPVEVTLPSRLSPILIIKDYGTGMSEDILMNVFTEYGSSTKRKNNIEMGGFGLGAKAPFAITSQFTIVSVSDGIKYTVIAGLDEKNVAELNFISKKETDEPNGVTFTIPVDDYNVILNHKDNVFLGCAPGQVKVDGTILEKTIHQENQWLKVGDKGWFNYRDFMDTPSLRTNPKVKIGSVIYEVTDSTVIPRFSSDVISKIYPFAVVSLNIGEVDLIPSREFLKYSSRTKTAIREAYSKYAEELEKSITDYVQTLDNRVDVLKYVYRCSNIGIKVPEKWKNETIVSKITNEKENIQQIFLEKTKTKTASPKILDLGHFSFTSDKIFVIDKESKDDKALTKNVRDFARQNGYSKVSIFSFNTLTNDENKWLDEVTEPITLEKIKNDGLEYRRSRRKKVERNTNGDRTVTSYTVLDMDSYTDLNKKSEEEYLHRLPSNIIPDNVYYLRTDKEISDGDLVTLGNIFANGGKSEELLSSFFHLGLTGKIVILSPRMSFPRFAKMFPKSINVVDKIDAIIDEKISQINKYDIFSKKISYNPLKTISPVLVDHLDKIENVETRKIISTFSNGDSNFKFDSSILRMVVNYGSKINALTTDVKMNDYPLLNSSQIHYYPNAETIEHVILYINMVDSL